jgi:hypothetical protein
MFFYIVKISEGPLQHYQQICVSYAYTTHMGHRFRLVLRGQNFTKYTGSNDMYIWKSFRFLFVKLTFRLFAKPGGWRDDRFVSPSLLAYVSNGEQVRLAIIRVLTLGDAQFAFHCLHCVLVGAVHCTAPALRRRRAQISAPLMIHFVN